MIFYFSGQFPDTRKDYPDGDKELDFFVEKNQPFDRLVCLIYGKDADQCFRNIRRLKNESKQRGTGRSADNSTPRRRLVVIPEFPDYCVTWNGRIYSRRNNKVLTPVLSYNGHERVGLSVSGTVYWRPVHRLVCTVFHGNPKDGQECNHKDGNKRNNHPENLEWCTRKENYDHACKIGLMNPISDFSAKQAQVIYALCDGIVKWKFPSLREAERSGFSRKLISQCLKGTRATYLDCIWKCQEGVYES